MLLFTNAIQAFLCSFVPQLSAEATNKTIQTNEYPNGF